MPVAAGVYFAESNSGQPEQPPVILLHGTGSSHQVWPAELRRLSGQRVFAVDLPGHGRSAGFGLQSIAAYAAHMVEFLAALGLYQAVFVGHSMGGAIALELAISHSEHVAGVCLISSGAYLGVPPDLLESFSSSVTVIGALQAYQQRAFHPQTSPAVIDQCMRLMRATRSSVMASDWRACNGFDRREVAPQIGVPCLAVAGADDRLTPVSYTHFLAGSIPNARLQIIPQAGHMVITEQPRRVAQSLQQFFALIAAMRRASPSNN